MEEFFLVKWWKSGCAAKLIISSAGLTLLVCMCIAPSVIVFSLSGSRTTSEKPDATSAEAPQVTAATTGVSEEPTTRPISKPSQTVTATAALSRDAFESACRGRLVENAIPYEPQPDSEKVHPAIAFLLSPDLDRIRAYQLDSILNEVEIVACITRISESFHNDCHYKADDGKKHVVHRYDAIYQMIVYSAYSGARLGEMELGADFYEWDCLPEISVSAFAKTEAFMYAQPTSEDIEAALLPYTKP